MGAATTAAVLGLAATPAKRAAQKRKATKLANGGKWGKQKQLLLGLRDRLTDQRNGLAKESAKEMESYGVHMADSGTDNFDRDFNLSLLSADQDVIYEIEEALKRIERGNLRHVRNHRESHTADPPERHPVGTVPSGRPD